MSSLRLFLVCLAILAIHSQTVPEAVPITNLPDQSQDAYQGWILSDNQTESYLYYQLFSAEGTSFNSTSQNSSKIPLILYLEGGACDSSTLTLYTDFGPYGVNSNINSSGGNNPNDLKFSLFKRDLTWSSAYHILSVDSPVFTGYSFSATGTVLNNTVAVGAQLVSFLTRFYQLYNQLIANPLFIVGHSYGGHWASYLSYLLLHDYNLSLNGNRISLGGVVLLNPMVSMLEQLGESDYFYAAGVTDTTKRDFLKRIDNANRNWILQGEFNISSISFGQEQAYLANMMPIVPITSNISLDNVRRNRLPTSMYSYDLLYHLANAQNFLNISYPGVSSARQFFNIPDGVDFLNGYCAESFEVSGDFAESYSYAVEYLLDQGIDVTFLGAQDDGTCPIPGIVTLVSSLNWTYASDYMTTVRNMWYDGNDNVVGAFKKYANLNMVTLYNSGHEVTFDQPELMMLFMNLTTSDTWQ